MILLITPRARGQECADALQLATGDETHWAHLLQGPFAHRSEPVMSDIELYVE
jgi:hypothetical protein